MPLTIEVANVGPIRHAQLSPGKLNVLIGVNDTGKTFFATVIHRVFSSRTEAFYPDMEPVEPIPAGINDFVARVYTALRQNGDHSDDPKLVIDDDMRRWANTINQLTLQRYGVAVRHRISFAYGVPIERIARQPSSYSKSDSYVSVENTEPQWSVRIPMAATELNDVIVTQLPDPDTWIHDVFSTDSIQRMSFSFDSRWSTGKGEETSFQQQVEEFSQHILYFVGDIILFSDWPHGCLHLPSERGGIMHSYRAIASAALRKSSFAGIEPIEIEPLDGTSRDFLSFIVSPESRMFRGMEDNTYSESASEVEDILRAEIDVVTGPSGLDRIVATTPEGQFELNQTSSMISEMSALVLALKHRLSPQDYLTIDEPEAHLHPDMQIEIARLLVLLASSGLSITLTTHSDYFVEEIKNAIRANVLRTQLNDETQLQMPHISQQDVRALWFVRSEDGCTATDATGDIVDPINEETFTAVSTRQYEESVPLIKQLLEVLGTTTEETK